MDKEKVQKDKQRSTIHTHETKDRVTRTPLRTGGELRCSGMVISSCSTSDTRRVNTCITSSAKYFGHNQDENKFWNHRKIIQNCGRNGRNGTTTSTGEEGELNRDEQLGLVYIPPLRNLQKGYLTRMERGTLQSHYPLWPIVNFSIL
jgi:hypothetical protein